MRDPSKEPKHFSNMHIQYMAEKAGRGLADSAPDVSALGALFAPSHPSTFQSLKPALLQKSSLLAPNPQDLDSMDVDGLFAGQNSPTGSSTDAWAPTADVADPPLAHSLPGQSHPPSRPEYSERYGREAICRFWLYNKYCNNGYDCRYNHKDDAHLPLAPPPPGYMGHFSPIDQSQIGEKDPLVDDNSLHSKSPWSKRHGDKSICYFWRTNGKCKKGSDCSYEHTDDPHLPIAPPPPGHSHLSDQLPANQHSHPTEKLDKPRSPAPATATLLPNGRPPWDKKDPYKAICHFWFTKNGDCRNSKCRYIHSNEIHLPVAPAPCHKDETCKFWAAGFCEKPAEYCAYLHEYSDGTPKQSDSIQLPEPSFQAPIIKDGAVTVTLGPRKSVSFAIDEPMNVSNEPESGDHIKHTATGPSNACKVRGPKYDRICLFYKKGICHRGKDCWYWHSSDGSDKQIPEMPAGSSMTKHARQDNATFNRAESPREEVNTAASQNAPLGSESLHPDRLRLVRSDAISLGPQEDSTTINFESEDTISNVPALVENHNHHFQLGNVLSRLQTHFDTPNTLFSDQGKQDVISPQFKRTEASMSDYRQKQAAQALGEQAKEVAFGTDETQSVWVDFGDLSNIQQLPWSRSFATVTKLHFTQSCLAQDFKAQLGSLLRQTLWQGSLGSVVNEPDQAATRILDKAWEHLRLNSAGFVAVCPDFWVLVYPAIEEWKFIEGSANFSPEMRLRYLIFEANISLR